MAMSKQQWISHKIKILMDEDPKRDQKQAAAIAYSLYKRMMQKRRKQTASEMAGDEEAWLSDDFELSDEDVAALDEAVVETEDIPSEEDDTPTDEDADGERIREYGLTTVFKGSIPNVPNAPGVDVEALTEGDPNPLFVTMKIAQIGRTSRAGILYDQALVESVHEQIVRKRVGGNFGHIKDEDAESAFPLPDGLWIGSALVGEYLFGKAYIRNPQAAKYVRDLKAVNGALGTSIWGRGHFESIGGGARRLHSLDLEKVDFAPPERASLQLDGAFEITSEMTDTGDQPMAVTKDDLAGMSASDLYGMMSDEQCEGIATMQAKKKGKKMIAAEMVSNAGFNDETVAEFEQLKADAPKLLRENKDLTTRIAEYERVEYQAGVDAIINDVFKGWQNIDKLPAEKQMRHNSVKSQLRMRLVSEMDGKQDLAIARSKVAAIAESDDFRPILEMHRDDVAGTAVIVGGRNGDNPMYAKAASLAKEVMGNG